MKKKITISIIVFVLLVIIYRLFFCYTIFCVPLGHTPLVGKVFTGGSKYDFPVCVMNPIKARQINHLIVNYTQINKDDQFGLVKNGKSRFKIVAANKEEDHLCFLLRDKERDSDICIVFTDKKGKEIKKIKW